VYVDGRADASGPFFTLAVTEPGQANSSETQSESFYFYLRPEV